MPCGSGKRAHDSVGMFGPVLALCSPAVVHAWRRIIKETTNISRRQQKTEENTTRWQQLQPLL
eukprot:266062-Chlamydomonas_euryale.AAC.1